MKLTIKPKSDKILITGAAGFIGFHLTERLLKDGYSVIGLDNLNDYYEPALKHDRLSILNDYQRFAFVQGDISDEKIVLDTFQNAMPSVVINLAAQAGVRYSIENPQAYIQSNIVGFANILEACRHYGVEHLLYASSSSVYGGNEKVPFSESDPVEHPVSLYAATKRSNELMADCYSHLYQIKATGLRFFTVYGPYGRPDMAYFSFTDRYFSGEPIKVYNNGDVEKDLYRDFTYIDDVVESVIRLIPFPPSGSPQHQIYNIGGGTPERLTVFIDSLEDALSSAFGRKIEFEKIYEPQKPGDVPATYADSSRLFNVTGFRPKTSLQEGLRYFANWYAKYYRDLSTRMPSP